MAAPLPTPRAFLTPKKPAAAIRLEQQLSDARQSTHRPRETLPDKGQSQFSHRSSDYGFSPEPISLDAMVAVDQGLGHEERYMQHSRTDHSMTDISTPPRITRDLSSDNLMHTRQSEKTLAGNHAPRPAGRIRNFKRVNNPQTTWFLGGRAMTGGDKPWSILLTVVIILGLTGVWLGTTGVWLWKHGTEYGLAKGAGIAIVIVLVSVECLAMLERAS
jgi:palmitoyltransferase ZDHHC9/14/18